MEKLNLPKISASEIKKRASSGDPEAERLLGLIYLDGTGVKKNVNEGFRLLRESADKGDSTSECDVGFCFHTGQGTNYNLAEAFRSYENSARNGDSKGHNNLGYCLFNGEGHSADLSQAVFHFKISAEKNCPEGLCNYGRCLEYGDGGVVQDMKRAAEMYKRAADLNNIHAYYCYGRCLMNGRGVVKDDKAAVSYFKQAMELHDEFGELYYNLMLFKGRGIDKNEREAAKYFQRGAISGIPHAQCYYGIALEYGLGVSMDVSKASAQYRMAADNGDPHAMFCLGVLFKDGKSVEKNEAECARLLKTSADNGYGRAQLMLAQCLESGKGVPNKFIPGAVSYFKAASDKGKYVGQFKYANYLEEGKFVEKNLAIALNLYRLSAEQHYALSEYRLGKLHEYGFESESDEKLNNFHINNNNNRNNLVEINMEKAAEFYRRAAEQRLSMAEDRYGKCLQRGRGTVNNPMIGVEYFRKSASQKDPAGQYHLGRSHETGLGTYSGQIDMNIAFNNYKLSANQNYPQALYHLGLLYKNGISTNTSSAINNGNNNIPTSGKAESNALNDYNYVYRKKNSHSNKNDDDINNKKKRDIVSFDLEQNDNEARKNFQTAALLRHPKALYEYGQCLLYGKGIKKDVEDAKNQFKLAAEKGEVNSMYKLGLVYRDIDKDDHEAIRWFAEASKNNHAVAQCELGKLLLSLIDQEKSQNNHDCVNDNNNFINKNINNNNNINNDNINNNNNNNSENCSFHDREEEAFELFEKSASLGYADGNYWYAKILEEGRGNKRNDFKPNVELAYQNYLLASEKSHPYATTMCGLYELRGVSTEANRIEGMNHFQIASRLGDPHADFLIGRCLEYGDGGGIQANQHEAFNFYMKAAEMKDPAALYSLGLMYARNKVPSSFLSSSISQSSIQSITSTKSFHSVTPIISENISKFPRNENEADEISSKQDNKKLKKNIGSKSNANINNNDDDDNNRNNDGNKEMLMKKAAELFNESASLGSACGMMCYSCCLARGEGVPINEDAAFELALEAIKKGIFFTSFGHENNQFEDETPFTDYLFSRQQNNNNNTVSSIKSSRSSSTLSSQQSQQQSQQQPQQQKGQKMNNKTNKNLNSVVNLFEMNSKQSSNINSSEKELEDLALNRCHKGAMFILSSAQREKIKTMMATAETKNKNAQMLRESAPWDEKAAKKEGPPKQKKAKRSIKMIQMTKKSITSHHKGVIKKPDAKHTYICV